jgi:general stress protein YciG
MPLQSRIDVESGPRSAESQIREDTAEDQRKMSRAEAGRKGGLSTKQRYGGDHFSRIGRLGGKKGGESTKRRYGVDFYKRIGRKGGSA